jgi:hypothetical protein
MGSAVRRSGCSRAWSGPSISRSRAETLHTDTASTMLILDLLDLLPTVCANTCCESCEKGGLRARPPKLRPRRRWFGCRRRRRRAAATDAATAACCGGGGGGASAWCAVRWLAWVFGAPKICEGARIWCRRNRAKVLVLVPSNAKRCRKMLQNGHKTAI